MSILDALRANAEARRVKAKELKDLVEERDALIRVAFKDGELGPLIAGAADLQVARVYQIRDGRQR